jgi:UDP-N-acetylmuramoylalanine--D-glutamate ligase
VEIAHKRVLVIGLGLSGSAAARGLAARGASLVMTDQRQDIERANLPAGDIYLGVEDPAALRGVDFVVPSPGVPPSSALLCAARAAGIPILGELELASRLIKAPIIGVTGTNGKSTVTMLLGEICKAARLKTFVGGNLGTPLIEAVDGDFDVIVAEVSSYQLETIAHFKPRVAIHLNLADDHLDRYRDIEEYGAAKARIFEFQDRSDWAVLNRDDPQVWKIASRVRSRVFSFGVTRPRQTPAVWAADDALAYDDGARQGIIDLKNFRLPGAHNRSNAAAAVAAALAMAIVPDAIAHALKGFVGLPHRIELVREKDGVLYIDDSKGTNVGAVIEALAATRAPVVLVAGGVDKGGSYAPLIEPLRDKVKLLILIGAARAKMSAALAGATSIECVETLVEAVAVAARQARSGDTVLLSPACSSFDQFKDYAERGRIFQELVRAL